MIAKQIIGAGFRGALDYNLHGSGGKQRERGKVLATNLPVTEHSSRAFASGFAAFRRLNPKLTRAVYHVSLSPAPGDVITTEQWPEIIRQYLEGMGFKDCAFVAIEHENEAEGNAVRPPHVHILASRIRPDGTTVSDQNNYRRSVRLVGEIEARFGLVAVAAKFNQTKKTKEGEMNDKQKQFVEQRLEAALDGAEDTMVIAQSPVSFGIEPAGTMSDSRRRDYKREILEAEYQQIIRLTFADKVRFVRKSGPNLVLHFHNGGRVVDSGDKVMAYAMPPVQAADAVIELALLKGWESVVLTGNEEFLKEAFTLALSKGLAVQPKPDQLIVFTKVQEEMERKKGRATTTLAVPEATPSATASVRGLSGHKGLSERLAGRSVPQSPVIDSAPQRPRPRF
ncbi:MAG: relaxase/mobilization nuclease domain-containing protein [Betaproteobacteria bacterium]